MDIDINTIIENDDWKIYCETSPSMPNAVIIHCKVYNWSHTKVKEYLSIWDNIVADLNSKGVTDIGTLVEPDNDKLLKFATMFGFNIKQEATVNGNECLFMVMDGV